MKFIVFGTVFGLVLAFRLPTALAATDCSLVVKQLTDMRQAQQTLLTSLADNHDTFALSLEETSDELASYPGAVPPKALKSMNKTAQAFRLRGILAKRQTAKLDAATAELIEQVSTCLRAKR